MSGEIGRGRSRNILHLFTFLYNQHHLPKPAAARVTPSRRSGEETRLVGFDATPSLAGKRLSLGMRRALAAAQGGNGDTSTGPVAAPERSCRGEQPIDLACFWSRFATYFDGEGAGLRCLRSVHDALNTRHVIRMHLVLLIYAGLVPLVPGSAAGEGGHRAIPVSISQSATWQPAPDILCMVTSKSRAAFGSEGAVVAACAMVA
jgi:hypothetical protein